MSVQVYDSKCPRCHCMYAKAVREDAVECYNCGQLRYILTEKRQRELEEFVEKFVHKIDSW